VKFGLLYNSLKILKIPAIFYLYQRKGTTTLKNEFGTENAFN
jgi:hypothetical protein